MTSAYREKPEPLVLNINKDFTFVIYDETNNISLFVGEVK
jgi:asparagine synthetase B (glutamine-hydrolysing)